VLKAGRHLYIEKSMAPSLDEAMKLIEAARCT
jgi:predicted dehydrogenase